jgi:hypothetical protein
MPFQLPNQTSFAQFKPIYSGSTWVRPADWITITDAPNEVQFLVSNVVYPVYAINTTFTQTGGVGNIYIDWGDGTTDTISTTASTTTNHTYTSGGTPSSRGYNTWKIRVYGDVGTTITNAQQTRNNAYWVSIVGDVGLLEAYYGDLTNITSFTNYFYQTTTFLRFNFIEYCKLPNTYNNSGALFQSTFRDCKALQKIVMPTSMPNVTNTSDMFSSCISLPEITLPSNMDSVLSMSSMFSNCYNLVNIVFPTSLPLVAGMSGFFQNCYSLGRVDLPLTPVAYQFDSMFQNCSSLLNVEIKSWSSQVMSGGNIFNMSSMFNGCRTLEDVKLPPSIAAGSIVNFDTAFNACSALKTFTFFENFNASSLNQTFNGCASLSKVVMPSSIPNLTSITSTFNGCTQLAELTLPNSVGATISMGSTFFGAVGLSEITIPSGWTITTLLSTFNGAVGLKKITLPNNAQNSLTSMATMCSGCFNLQSIVMPTSMTSLTTLANAFLNCNNLKTVVFPSSLNAVTTMASVLQNCSNLTGVTLPTSMTLVTAVNSLVQSCVTLKSIVMPASAPAITNYGSAFASCNGLNNITFPTSAQNSLSVLGSTFNQCWSLTGLTNTQSLGNSGTTGTIYVDFSGADNFQLPLLDMYCKFSKFVLTGQATKLTPLASLRLRNTGTGQYAGTSPQINISYNGLGQAALVQVFNDLPTLTSKTINITGCSGAAALTPAERAIATGKGWTIVG